jgi:hypothetical protein
MQDNNSNMNRDNHIRKPQNIGKTGIIAGPVDMMYPTGLQAQPAQSPNKGMCVMQCTKSHAMEATRQDTRSTCDGEGCSVGNIMIK